MISNRQLHKFGGSSLVDDVAITRVCKLIIDNSSQGDIVVVSASGKTTDNLLRFISLCENHDDYNAYEVLNSIYEKHLCIIKKMLREPDDLLATFKSDYDALFNVVGLEVTEKLKREIVSYGELWSMRMLSCALSESGVTVDSVDSRSILKFSSIESRDVSVHKSSSLVEKRLAPDSSIFVVTGYIASSMCGETVLLGRNGSDYSATLIASLANVDKVTIWSDVAGVHSADPRIVNGTNLISNLHLDEASDLAHLSSSVLHKRTLQPIKVSGASLSLRSSISSDEKNTNIIRTHVHQSGPKVVTSTEKVTAVTIACNEGKELEIFLEQIRNYLVEFGCVPVANFILPCTREVVLVIDDESVHSAIQELKLVVGYERIQLETDISLVAVVGRKIGRDKGYLEKFSNSFKSELLYYSGSDMSENSLVAIVKGGIDSSLVQGIHDKMIDNKENKVGILLFGNGNIGTQWLKLFHSQRKAMSEKYGVVFSLVGVTNSSIALIKPCGIEPISVESQFEKYAKPYGHVTELLEEVKSFGFGQLIALDITSSKELTACYPKIAEYGFHLVTANKIMGSSSGSKYREIQSGFKSSGLQLLSNATVGAGLPINSAISDLRNCGDSIRAICGVYSGTLSWLFEKYDGSVPFSRLVAIAREQGITEPDPRSDLDGSDVMKKLLILVREAGIELEPEQIEVESLVPPPLRDVSLDGFFSMADILDEAMKKKLDAAHKKGKVLRYTAKFSLLGGEAYVGLEELELSNPLASLTPCDNVFMISSDWYSTNPLIIRGPGAGREVTAGALQSDVLKLAKLFSSFQ